jgi:integrase
MSASVIKTLLAHRQRCRQTTPSALVFVNEKGKPFNPDSLLKNSLHPTCELLGLPRVGWQSFRHTHATLLGETGESLRTAQAILGHSDLKTTLNVYMHAVPEAQRRAMEKVAEILDPNGPKLAESGKDSETLTN